MLLSEFYERINKEFDSFKTKLLQRSSEQIFSSAYEIVYKEEIFDILFNEDISEKVISILLSKKDILEYIYQLWQCHEYSSMDNMREVINSI